MIKKFLRNSKAHKMSVFALRTAVIIFVVVLISYVLFISLDYIHEQGHIYEASNYGINFTVR